MGTWQATIVATGTHDMAPGSPDGPVKDSAAENMVKAFVEDLRSRGHHVHLVAVGPANHHSLGTPDRQRSGVFVEPPSEANIGG